MLCCFALLFVWPYLLLSSFLLHLSLICIYNTYKCIPHGVDVQYLENRIAEVEGLVETPQLWHAGLDDWQRRLPLVSAVATRGGEVRVQGTQSGSQHLDGMKIDRKKL